MASVICPNSENACVGTISTLRSVVCFSFLHVRCCGDWQRAPRCSCSGEGLTCCSASVLVFQLKFPADAVVAKGVDNSTRRQMIAKNHEKIERKGGGSLMHIRIDAEGDELQTRLRRD